VKPKRLKLKRVAIVGKHHAKEIASVLATLVDWFEARGAKVNLESALAPLVGAKESFPLSKPPRDVDFFIVLGGDGTLLSVARAMGSKQLPILGVNLGSLGFLTDVAVKNLYSSLEAISEGEVLIDSRMMLNSTLVRKGEVIIRDTLLNDVVITKGAIARIIEVGIDVDDQFVSVLRADGVIVSTPTGSTAYSLAAGGPILHPNLEAMIITPICPHTLTYRPVVLSDRVAVTLTLRGDPGEVFATFDGQASKPLEPGDVIKVHKSRYSVKLISLPDKNYFKLLRHKLRWAERPRSRRHTPPPTP
jgi:NAD+ kinase